MDFLIRDLSDGSFAGIVLKLPKKPSCPEGFEATAVSVSSDKGDLLAINGNSTVAVLTNDEDTLPESFLPEHDAQVWRTFASFQDWKEELQG